MSNCDSSLSMIRMFLSVLVGAVIGLGLAVCANLVGVRNDVRDVRQEIKELRKDMKPTTPAEVK